MNATQHLKGITALACYWTSLFLLLRLIFILRYKDSVDQIGSVIYYGFTGDLAITTSIISLSSLILLFQTARNTKVTFKTLKYFSLFVLFCIISIEYSSSVIYQEWGSTLTWRATSYLSGSTSGWQTMLTSIDIYLALYVCIGAAFTILISWIYKFFL